MKIRLFLAAVTALGMTDFGASATHVDVRYDCAENYDQNNSSPSLCNGSDIPDSCDNAVRGYNKIRVWPSWDGQGGWSELNAWSDDWREQDGKGGQDETYFDRGDVGDLVIWSGHGTCGDTNAWAASFTQPNHGGCLCDTGGDGGADYEMHFGERSGNPWNGDGASKWVAMDASCSMMIAEIKEVWYWQPNGIMGRVNQGFGFNASPYDKPDRLEKWANKIAGGKNNVVAWLEAGCETGGCSKNKPAVITKGPDQASAIERSNNANLKNVRYPPPPFWGSYFYWVYY